MRVWFPGEIEVISCSKQYHIRNNEPEARQSLWEWITFGEWVSQRG